MNEKGQFLLYDLIFAIIILLLVMVMVGYVLSSQTTVYESSNNYKKPLDELNVLDSTVFEDNTLLYNLAYSIDTNDTNLKNKTLTLITQLLSSVGYDYVFNDVTTNQTLLDTSSNNRIVYSARKIVNSHVFELNYCSK